MPDFLAEKPTAQSIAELRSHLDVVWGRARIAWEQTNRFLDGTFQVWSAQQLQRGERPIFRPSTGKHIVDHAADVLVAHDPKIHRGPTARGRQHKQRADALELGLTAAEHAIALLETVPANIASARHMCAYGITTREGPIMDFSERIIQPEQYSDEDDADFESRMAAWEAWKRTYNPFRIRALPPSVVLMDPMRKNPQEAIKVQKRYGYELEQITVAKAAYNKKQREKKRRIAVDLYKAEKRYQEVEVLEYWNVYWHAVLTGDRLLYVEDNPFGFVPFTQAYAGWGNLPAGINAFDPAYLAIGLLDAIKEMLVAEAQLISSVQAITIQQAYPWIQTDQDPADLAQKMAGEITPGDWKWVQPVQVGQDLFQHVQNVRQGIMQGTYNLSQAGFRETGVTTASQQAQLNTAAQRKFLIPNLQLGWVSSVELSNLLRLVDLSDEVYHFGEHALDPADIEHDYNIEATFTATDAALQMQAVDQALRLVQAGLMSKESFWKVYLLEDVEGERKRLIEDRIEANPAVAEAEALPVAEEMGLQAIIQAAKEKAQAQGGARPTPLPSADLAAEQAGAAGQPNPTQPMPPPQVPGLNGGLLTAMNAMGNAGSPRMPGG